MLVSGPRGAPYTCLRCQLRQAIFHTRRSCLDQNVFDPRRFFSGTPRRRNQEDDEPIRVPHQQNDLVYHRPLGRIVGAPGRRQRQGTQKLKIDAMKQPFEVIIMQDVREPEERRIRPRNMQSNVVSAADIEREMASEGRPPTQGEVNEAIRALRPDTTILDEQQFKDLGKSLADGFTVEQLHAYLSQSLNLSAIEGDTVHLLRQQPNELQTRYQQTQWRPGRTRLEKRLPLGAVIKKSEKVNKSKLVEQILRLAWNLSMHAEEQRFGELEMKLERWELKYLFDLKLTGMLDNVQMVEHFIDSDLLSRACDVRPFRPHGYLRITGRRQDAEEVAQKLAQRLSDIKQSTVVLEDFKPMLGTPGWPTSLEDLWKEEEIDHVQRRTFTIIEQPRPDTLHIYSTAPHHQDEARRLLLALLELPAPGSTAILQSNIPKKATLLPEAAGTAIHLRHRKLDMARLTLPTVRVDLGKDTSDKSSGSSRRKAESTVNPRMITKQLDGFAIPAVPGLDDNTGSDWHFKEVTTVNWKTQLCRVLYTANERTVKLNKRSSSAADDAGPFTIIGPQVHNFDTLLSFFKPRQGSEHVRARYQPLLIARFVPSISERLGLDGLKTLPVIELAYYFFTDDEGKQDIFLVRLQAILQKQDLRVPLPSEATDLCFERWTRMVATGSRMVHDDQIAEFTRVLRESLQAGKQSTLLGNSEVTFRLPASLFGASGEAKKAASPYEGYSYMFMGFEQSQKREFSPIARDELPKNMDPEFKSMLGSLDERFFLQLREVSAGTLGGRRTEVLLHYAPKRGKRSSSRNELGVREGNEGWAEAAFEATDDVHGDDGAPLTPRDKVHTLMAKTALGLAQMLTKISRGEIHQRVVHELPEPREEDGEARDDGIVSAFTAEDAAPAQGAGER